MKKYEVEICEDCPEYSSYDGIKMCGMKDRRIYTPNIPKWCPLEDYIATLEDVKKHIAEIFDEEIEKLPPGMAPRTAVGECLIYMKRRICGE